MGLRGTDSSRLSKICRKVPKSSTKFSLLLGERLVHAVDFLHPRHNMRPRAFGAFAFRTQSRLHVCSKCKCSHLKRTYCTCRVTMRAHWLVLCSFILYKCVSEQTRIHLKHNLALHVEIRNKKHFQIYGMRVLTQRKTQQYQLLRVLPLVASQAPSPIPPYIPFAPRKKKNAKINMPFTRPMNAC